MLNTIVRIICSIWHWFELVVFSLVLFILSWLPRILTGNYYHKLSCIWCKYLVRALGVELRLHQKNIRPLPEQYILIANHPSALEDFGIPALFDVYPLAKLGVRYWFIIGRISYAANTIYVKRDNSESRHAALTSLMDAVKKGRNIALFPEGGCKGRRIQERFHTGAFEISIQTGIPILPLFLHYEAQDRFEWRDPYTLIGMLWRIMTSQNHRANYYVYDAISPEGFSDKKAFAEHVHAKYLEWQKRYLD